MHPPESPVSPPLSRWSQLWRIGLVLLISAVSVFELWPLQLKESVWLLVMDASFGVVAFVLMFFRRRWPLGVALLTTLLSLGSAAAAGPSVLAYMSLATRRRWREIVPVGLLVVVVGQLFYYYQPSAVDDPPWLNFTWLVIITIAMTAIGMYIGSRRELVWTLRERAQVAESEAELRLAQARSSERERIAREMHDVLAHRISLVTMHAGALAYRTDLDPDTVRETAELISATSHEALSELREVLGTLRDEGVRPQPAYDDIGELVADSPGAVLVDEVTDPVPDWLGRTAYRVVQEALTNARKHAPGEPATVSVAGAPGAGLNVTVRNAKPARPVESLGSGLGLVGMRERIETQGGRLVTSDTGGHFHLEAWLPWSS